MQGNIGVNCNSANVSALVDVGNEEKNRENLI